jgi:hypothetical protein
MAPVFFLPARDLIVRISASFICVNEKGRPPRCSSLEYLLGLTLFARFRGGLPRFEDAPRYA